MAPTIYAKMLEVMKEIGAVTKDQTNGSQGFKFRGIDQFVNALYPTLCKHGVFMAPECVSETHELKDVTRSNGKVGVDKHVAILMKYHFFAADGSSVVVGPIPAEGLDSGDKATNKALSAALKYALIQTFTIPTQDMEDADRVSPELLPASLPATTSASVDASTSAPVASSAAPAKSSSWRKAKGGALANGHAAPAAAPATADMEF